MMTCEMGFVNACIIQRIAPFMQKNIKLIDKTARTLY